MCDIKTKRCLHNTNRLIIAFLTAIGLLMDGHQYSDAIFGLSVLIWLWLPECTRIEEMAVDQFSTDLKEHTRTFEYVGKNSDGV